MKELKDKTVTGLLWNAGYQIGSTLSNLIITLILVRYLSPADFGEIGMITVISGFASVFLDFGLGNAVIQSKDISQNQKSTIFWISTLMGGILAAGFVIFSPLIASFYNVPRLEILTKFISINFIFTAIAGIPRSLLVKEMKFKHLFYIDLTTISISGIIAITAALKGFGIWSLVLLLLSNAFFSLILVWITKRWWPCWVFNLNSIESLLPFSFNLTGNSMLGYIARNLDNLLIGKVMGESALGLYSKSYSFLMFPLKNITKVFNQVLFPSFSAIQQDYKKIASIYLKSIAAIALIVFPGMMFIFIIAESLVKVLFGAEWMAMIPLIKIFCFLGAIQSVLGTTGSLFLSQRRTDLELKFSLVTKFFLFIGLFIAVQNNLIMVAYFWLIFTIVTGYAQMYLATRLIDLKMDTVFRKLLPVTLITVLSSGFTYLMHQILVSNLGEGYLILIDIVLITISYIIFLYLFKVEIFFVVIALLKAQYLKYAKNTSSL